jgi:hypothetical protein
MSTLNVDKVDPSSGTALEIGSSGDTITVPSGATFVVAGTTEITGTNNVQRPNAQPLIINGDCAIAQRSSSVASITAAGYYTVDRWLLGNTNGGTWTQSQEALTADEAYEDGFSTALKMDCTTADASLGAADNLIVQQRIEAQDLQLLKFGSSTSATLTLGFWVKSTKTGTCIAELYQTDDARSCSKSYTISSTNTWEYKVLDYPVDTTGVIDNNNDTGLTVLFWMAAGTNFTSGTLNTTWGTATAANRAVGQINCADDAANNFHVTGVQLEVGTYTSSTIPPFQFESYGDNLNRCQRYFNRVTSGQTSQRLVIGENVNTSSNAPIFQHHPPLRAAPGLTVDNVGQFLIYSSASTYAATNIVTDVMNTKSSSLVVTVTGTMGAGNAGQFVAHATAKLDFDSEL